jgi:hypothetical protein
VIFNQVQYERNDCHKHGQNCIIENKTDKGRKGRRGSCEESEILEIKRRSRSRLKGTYVLQQTIETATINFVVTSVKTMTSFLNMSSASAPIHITEVSVK